MRKHKTRKQELYFDEVIRLHYEDEYGEDRISSILLVGYTTIVGWIAVFASEKDVVSDMKKSQDPVPQVYGSGRLKNELLKRKVFMSMDEARCVGELVKRWPSYRLIAIKNKLDEAQVMKKVYRCLLTVTNSDQRLQGNKHTEVNMYQS